MRRRGAAGGARRRFARAVPLLALAAAAAALAYLPWRFWYAPRESESVYEVGYRAYAEGDLEAAREHLRRAVDLDPRSAEARTLLGWTHWRLGEVAEAEPHFRAAHEQDTSAYEAKAALGMVLLALDRIEDALPILEDAARARPHDSANRLRLAEAYRRSGRNRVAVALYREMLARDPSQFRAEQALLEMFGYPRLGPGTDFSFPPLVRPEELQLPFRTRGDHFQVFDGGRWRTTYLTGVNLGPARPGEWAVSASLAFDTYAEWLRQIAAAGANTVRVYTILPPAFYAALRAHNLASPEPLWLIQEVWLAEDALDLYDPVTRRDFEREMRSAVDVIHGQADIGCRTGHYCGMYTADVSRWVIGIGVGREVEPRVVRATNRLNPERTSYRGTYVSLDSGTPAEVWFAEVCDLTAQYETETYNAQRPLTIVTWPPLDPMTHPTEATYEEELRIRRARGEEVPDSAPLDMNDMDAVSIHVARFRIEPAFRAGLFALYHVYQHWPDFMFLEERYAEARDAEGPNRYLGYLLDLKAHHPDFPLLIGEYGVSTSLAPAHLHPDGWHNGGLSEDDQARLLARFTRNIRDAGMAGGIVFQWADEWWKQVHDEFNTPLEQRTNDPLWLNVLDPEEFFGIVGYRAFDRTPLLRGADEEWAGADTLYVAGREGGGAAGAGPLRAVYAAADYAYLYLRLDLDTLAAAAWSRSALRIALNALPGQAGSTALPGGVRLPSGATFLVEIDGLSDARLRMASGYDPWHSTTNPGRPDLERVERRTSLRLALDESPFVEVAVEVNQPRWARDGTEFPPLRLGHGALLPGSADPADESYHPHALWNVDARRGRVELRIPWLRLLVLDPIARSVFAGTDALRSTLVRSSDGIAVSVLAFGVRGGAEGPGEPELLGSFPAAAGGVLGEPRVYRWRPWTRVRYEPYLKPAYHALRAIWRGWPRYLD